MMWPLLDAKMMYLCAYMYVCIYVFVYQRKTATIKAERQKKMYAKKNIYKIGEIYTCVYPLLYQKIFTSKTLHENEKYRVLPLASECCLL